MTFYKQNFAEKLLPENISCVNKHSFNILNIKKNYEVFGHNIILIKGQIKNACAINEIIIVDLDSDLIKTDFIIQQTGEFKFLWQSRIGVNKLSLKYCNVSTDITYEFKKPHRNFRLQPIYIKCKGHDGRFMSDCNENTASDACKKIDLGLKLVQLLYAEKLNEMNFGRKTFTINGDCEIFNSSLDVKQAQKLNDIDLWKTFAKEIINSKISSDDKIKFIGFIGCTVFQEIKNDDFSYENIRRHSKANAAYGTGGLAIFGSGCLYTWPTNFDDILKCFQDKRQINLRKFIDESNYRRTYGGCFASTIGAVCHEIGHIFDLGHTIDGIMGKDFDYTNLFFTNTINTEILPDRIVCATKSYTKDKRLTKLTQPGSFLTKYHQQKINDSTFFSLNCAIILNYHKWFNNYNEENKSIITLDKLNLHVYCDKSTLVLLEIRQKSDGLVLNFVDFSQKSIKGYNINGAINFDKENLFVITSDGTVKLFT